MHLLLDTETIELFGSTPQSLAKSASPPTVLGHIYAVCSVDLHMLHLCIACCSRLTAASAVGLLHLVWAGCAQNRPSTSVRTPPLAIYMHYFALFLFWCWFYACSFLFPLASRTALNIAILQLLTSWLSACSIRLSRLCIHHLK